MCGPRQLFFFQGGTETPKGWTPLQGFIDPLKGVQVAEMNGIIQQEFIE